MRPEEVASTQQHTTLFDYEDDEDNTKLLSASETLILDEYDLTETLGYHDDIESWINPSQRDSFQRISRTTHGAF
jgi:hypothetical protein